MKKSLLFIFLLSISSSRAVSERNTQQKELSIGKASYKAWSYIEVGKFLMSFIIFVFIYVHSTLDSPLIKDEGNDWDQVKQHINNGEITMMTTSPKGRTVLQIASLYDQKEIVQQLVSNGQKSHLIDQIVKNEVFEALKFACSKGNIDIVKLLINNQNLNLSLTGYQLNHLLRRVEFEIKKWPEESRYQGKRLQYKQITSFLKSLHTIL